METQDTTKTAPENKSGCLCGDKCRCKHHWGKFKIITIVVGVLLVILLSFAAGAGIALRKARFSCFRGQGNERNFIGSPTMQPGEGGPRGFFRQFEGRDFQNGHGLAGIISSIADNNIVVKDRDGKETTVATSDQTAIRNGNANLKITDLKQNDQITVMGKPGDNGVINATLIRVFGNNASGNANNINNNSNAGATNTNNINSTN